MLSYYADLILDFEWYGEHGGQLLQPRSCADRKLEGFDRICSMWLFGDDRAIKHFRVTFEAASDEEAGLIISANVVLWRNAIATTSALTGGRYASATTFDERSADHVMLFGQGDISTPPISASLTLPAPGSVSYLDAASMMARWNSSFAIHLHFLAQFFNTNLPADIRWLQGYKVLEWHFERGKTNLGRNQKFKRFVEEHGAGLDDHNPSNRTRAGFLEETRALIAHAVLANRPQPEDQAKVQNAARNTFRVMEGLVAVVMSECAAEGIEFKPKLA